MRPREQFELCIRKNFMYAPAWESLEEVNKEDGETIRKP